MFTNDWAFILYSYFTFILSANQSTRAINRYQLAKLKRSHSTPPPSPSTPTPLNHKNTACRVPCAVLNTKREATGQFNEARECEIQSIHVVVSQCYVSGMRIIIETACHFYSNAEREEREIGLSMPVARGKSSMNYFTTCC